MPENALDLEAQADAAARSGNMVVARRLLVQATDRATDKPELWMKLAAMCRASGDATGALVALDGALRIDPLDFAALLAKATTLDQLGRPEAGEAYGHALAQRPEPLPPVLIAPTERAEERWRAHRAGALQKLRSALPADLPPIQGERVERFCSNVARVTRPYPQGPSHFAFPGLPVAEFHPREAFGFLDGFEADWQTIASEFETVVQAEAAELVPYIHYPEGLPLRQWAQLNRSRNWTAVHLLQNGSRVETNARHCPKTMELLARAPQPQVPGFGPNAMFSLLAPGTRIPPHTGVANTRLVCHLPLIVPGGCGFRVGATTRAWVPGKAFVFDDTVEHEAWNDSRELRVVLIFDIWAPALSQFERSAVGTVMMASGAANAAL